MTGAGGVELVWRLWDVDNAWGSVFLLHGLGEHSGRYAHLAERLAFEGISVFSFDLRGHGESGGPRGDVDSFDLFLDDVLRMEAVHREVVGSGVASFLLGHSLGGLIALRRLQMGGGDYSGAVLSAPWLRAAQPAWLRALGRGLGSLLPALPLPNGLGPHRLTRDPEKAQAWREDPLIHTRLTGGLFREAERAQRVALAQPGALGTGPLPLLFLVPEKDLVVDASVTLAFAGAFTGEEVHVEILEGRLHEAFNDLGWQEVLDLLARWLTGMRG